MSTLTALKKRTGGLSVPSKMPCHGYSLPAENCKTGSKLAKNPNSICSICYAAKGRYLWPTVATALKNRLATIELDTWVDDMVEFIGKKEKSGFFRWHDSGDVQSVEHLENIAEIARRLPDIKFWLPTREYGFVKLYYKRHGAFPKNLTVRLSAFMKDGAPPKKVAESLGGLTTSGVATDDSFNCPSSKQENQCGDCRACWDENQPNINYKAH